MLNNQKEKHQKEIINQIKKKPHDNFNIELIVCKEEKEKDFFDSDQREPDCEDIETSRPIMNLDNPVQDIEMYVVSNPKLERYR